MLTVLIFSQIAYSFPLSLIWLQILISSYKQKPLNVFSHPLFAAAHFPVILLSNKAQDPGHQMKPHHLPLLPNKRPQRCPCSNPQHLWVSSFHGEKESSAGTLWFRWRRWSGLSSHVPHSNRVLLWGRQGIEQKTLGGDLQLALKMVGGVVRQGVQESSRSWKRESNRPCLEPREETQPWQRVDFRPWDFFIQTYDQTTATTNDSHYRKIVNLCCFKPLFVAICCNSNR